MLGALFVVPGMSQGHVFVTAVVPRQRRAILGPGRACKRNGQSRTGRDWRQGRNYAAYPNRPAQEMALPRELKGHDHTAWTKAGSPRGASRVASLSPRS